MNIRIVVRIVVAIIVLMAGYVPTYGYSIFLDASNNNHATGIPDWLRSWGNTVTVVADYKGENLAGYDIVMDMDNDAYHALTQQERTGYTSFLNRGGGLYLQGERPIDNYLLRDKSVLAYLEELGSGTIEADWRDIFLNFADPYVYAVPSPVTQNTSLRYHYDTSLLMTNPGNGFFVATTNRIDYPYTMPHIIMNGVFSFIIGFDRGQLLNAPNGRVIGFFDTTFLDAAVFDENAPFFKEVVSFLGNNDTVTIMSPIPEPSTLALLAGGGALLLGLRRRQRRKAQP